MSNDDRSSTGEDFAESWAATIECPQCGLEFRSAARMTSHEGDELCQEVQADVRTWQEAQR